MIEAPPSLQPSFASISLPRRLHVPYTLNKREPRCEVLTIKSRIIKL